MSFLKLLHGIGDRLGILEAVAAPDSRQPTRIQTRCVSIRDLAGEIRSEEIRELAASPAELSVPFEKIFEAAGVSTDPPAWTMERLKQFVSDESLKNKSREDVQRAILDALHSNGVSVDSILKDAMARDKAMDSYEDLVGQKMKARMETRKRRSLEIESRIRELQAEARAVEAALKADEETWRAWRKNKKQHERELATLVGYLVDHAVITLDENEEA
ncbi:MAG: hypothetical protein QUT30_06615 [Acidobacteriota bacterium]|nr:hypothetical protein [Acidobacteriota bacterium]